MALFHEDPANARYRRAVMNGALFIGRQQANRGDYASALAQSRTALESAEALSASDPLNTMYRRDLWICHFRMGEAITQLGDPAKGLSEYRKSLAYIDALSAADPGDTGHQRGRAVTRLAIADLFARTGRKAAAVRQYRGAIAISQSLEAADPKKTETRIDLANMYSHLGRALQDTGQPGARTAFEKARALFDQAAKIDPGNAIVAAARTDLEAQVRR